MQFLKMTAKQYRSWKKSPSKYHAEKTIIGDTVYDSKKEAKRGIELEYLQRIGQIKDLQKQVRFILQEDYVNNEGQKIRPISYIADYVYEQDGKKIVEDVKGVRTDVYLLKKKMFMFKYPEYKFIET